MDQYGDSYTEDATDQSLKEVLVNCVCVKQDRKIY